MGDLKKKKKTRIECQPTPGITIQSQITLFKGCGSLALDKQSLCTGYLRRAPFILWPVGMTAPGPLQWKGCVAVSSGPAD